VVHEVIDEHADVLFVPREFIRVELRDVHFVLLVAVVPGVVSVCRVFGTVGPVVRAIDDVFAVDGFDDVDFAAGGPPDGVEVFAEHPECGPDSFARGERDTGFYCAVLECELAFGNHAGRGVLLSFVVFFLRTNVQNPVLDVGVILAACVVFLFVVAPAVTACADFEHPFGCVDCFAVEFVVPEVG